MEVFYSSQLLILAVIQRPKSTFNMLLVDTNLKGITKLFKKSLKLEPFIFTNYNGLGDREDKKYEKYGVLLGNALVWEM